MQRRDFLKMGLASTALAGCATAKKDCEKSPALQNVAAVAKAPGGGDPRMRGPFPILSTPFHEDGRVDYETLAKAVQFVDDCGCPGVIWCQANPCIDLLTFEEKKQGYEACAKALQGRKIMLTFGCNGKDAAQAVREAKAAEEIAAKYPRTNIAIASRPPDTGKTQEDIRDYYEKIAAVVKRPVIIQTYVNNTCPAPKVSLLVELAKKYPTIYGYIKEESDGPKANDRMLEEVKNKPVIHAVYSAWGGWQWLYQSRRLGSEGLVTERCAYADLLTYIWEQMENGDKNGTLDEAFSRLGLMLNLDRTVGGNNLRGFSLYILQKRGVFKNTVSREYPNKADKKAGRPWHTSTFTLRQSYKDEIDTRFASLKKFLKV